MGHNNQMPLLWTQGLELSSFSCSSLKTQIAMFVWFVFGLSLFNVPRVFITFFNRFWVDNYINDVYADTNINKIILYHRHMELNQKLP